MLQVMSCQEQLLTVIFMYTVLLDALLIFRSNVPSKEKVRVIIIFYVGSALKQYVQALLVLVFMHMCGVLNDCA